MSRNAALLLIMSLTGAGGSAPAGQERPLSPRDEQVIAGLIRDLRGGAEDARLEATRSLGVIGPPARAAVPDLVARMTAEDDAAALEAARAVLAIGADHAAAGPALVRALSDPKPDDRVQAMAAIGLLLDVGEGGHLKGGGHQPDDVNAIIARLGPAGRELVPAVVGNLKAADPAVREAAVRLLWDLGRYAATAVPALIETLDDPAENVRALVPRSLISVGPDSDAVVPALLRSASAEELETRFHPWGRYQPSNAPGDPAALADALKDQDPAVRRMAAFCLWEVGPRADLVLPAVRAALKDPDDEVRLIAAGALIARRPGDAEAGAILVDALPRLARVRQPEGLFSVTAFSFYADVLGHLGEKATPEIPRLIRSGLGFDGQSGEPEAVARQTLVKLGPVAVPALKAVLDGPVDRLCTDAAGVLGAIGPAAADAVPTLVGLMDAKDPRVRSVAAHALGQIGPAARAALPALRRRLDLPDPAARIRVAAVLWRIERDPSLLAVLDEGLKPGHPALQEAVEVFRSIGAESIPRLSRALRSSDDPGDMVALYGALAAVDPSRRAADAALSEMLADRDQDVRRNAARASADLGPDARGCIPALVLALADDDVFLPRIAAYALVKVDPNNRDLIAFLIRQLAGVGDDSSKAEAARMLGECGARAAVAALKAAIDGPEGQLRDDAIAALWGIDKQEVPVFLRPRVLHPGGFR
jgi:HEAT repeat protein